jgi:hypothetical protein
MLAFLSMTSVFLMDLVHSWVGALPIWILMWPYCDIVVNLWDEPWR